MKNYFLAIILFGVWVTACDPKKNNEAVPTKTKKELLVGSYLLTTISANPGILDPFTGQKITDVYKFLIEDCQKDDIFIFTSDQKSKIDAGTTKCNPKDPQVSSEDSWKFNAAEDSLSIGSPLQTGPTEFDKMKIVELTETNLKLQTTIKNLDGSSSTILITFTKK